jgi:ABC-type Fe3+-hydroxamate transport system substrate-binding protein
MPLLECHPGWRELNAVQSDRIFVATAISLSIVPGLASSKSLEILAEVFHPELFPA